MSMISPPSLIPLSAARRGLLGLAPFEPAMAGRVASWVTSPLEHLWVAPSTPPPLTAEKIIRWQRPEGQPHVLLYTPLATPVGYAEINPLSRDRDHFWLGHIVVDPVQRGRGVGLALVREVIGHAFRALAASRVSLVVFPDNAAAIACYRRAGMEQQAREHHQFAGRGPRYELLRFEIARGRWSRLAAAPPGSPLASPAPREGRTAPSGGRPEGA